MSWTGSGRKTAALCTAVVLLGTLALPAQASPRTALPETAGLAAAGRVPASPEIPSPGEIAAAKSSESATAAEVTRIDGLLADASAAQETSLGASLQANNAYGEALVELATRREAAAVAAARAAAAGAQQAKTRKQLGQLAGDLYRNGGLNPALSSFVSGTGQALEDAATLEAVTAGRARAFQSAETAAAAAQSLTESAADAKRAADEAATTAEARKTDADRAAAAQRQAVADAKAQRKALVGQLASLKHTTAALESARVDALDRQRQQEQLAALTAAANAEPQPGAASQPASASQPAPAAPGGDTSPGQQPRPPLPRRLPSPHTPPRRLPSPRPPRLQLLRRPLRRPRFPFRHLRRFRLPFRRPFPAAQTRRRFPWRSARPARRSSTSTAEPGPTVLTARAWCKTRSRRLENTCPARPRSSSRRPPSTSRFPRRSPAICWYGARLRASTTWPSTSAAAAWSRPSIPTPALP